MSVTSSMRLALGRDECHVWRVLLDRPDAARDGLCCLLSPEEKTRAARFVFEAHRRRFVVAHGCLREILASYVGAAPASLVVAFGPAGKPFLTHPESSLRFSLSHSGSQALVAVAWGREVGIDLEAVRDVQDIGVLAASCFSPTERRALAEAPEASRLEAFFDGWTRKEAFVKMLGEGLSRQLDTFDVTLAPGEPARLLRVEGGRADDWTLRALEVGPGFRGALAIEGTTGAIRLRDWQTGHELGRNDGGRGAGRHEDVPGGGEPGGAVLDLAGRQGAAERLAGCGQERDEGRVPGVGQGGLDRHDARQPAGGPVLERLTFGSSPVAGARP